jgi:hypothetical protein
MSSIPLTPGATRVIKLSPNNSFIPTTIDSIDQLFDLSLLSHSKFSTWKTIATEAGKIAISDNTSEKVRFIDSNFDLTTPKGSLWFLGKAEADNCYYLQTGIELSKDNDPSVFIDHISSAGFEEASTVFLDRVSERIFTGSDTTHSVPCVVGNGVGLLDTLSKVAYTPLPTEWLDQSKLTISMLIQDNNIGNYTVYMSTVGDYGLTIENYEGMVGLTLFSYSTFYGEFDITEFISNGVPFLLTVVFDGTQTDGNIDIQNQKRLKVYVNDTEMTLDYYNPVPSKTWSGGNYPYFWLGSQGYSTDIVISEFRMVLDAWTTEEVDFRYNQYFNKSTYWTPTIQPVISTAVNIGPGRWQITGTGFIPESTDPTGTINGVNFIIQSSTDTSLIIDEGSGTPPSNKLINIINSDGESDSISATSGIDRKAIEGDSPFNFIGMPPPEIYTPGELQHTDTKLGNPLGDVVDNTAGENPVDGTENGGTVKTVRGGGGCNLGMYSKPSWLCK